VVTAAPPGRLNGLLFWPFWFVVGLLLRLACRLRIEGAPPAAGACVLAANHTSYLDPIVLGVALRRRVVFLMTEVVYRARAGRWFYRWNHAIPVAARGANLEALRTARAVLQQGRVIGIFPEGGISRDGLPLLGNPGAVALVLQEDVSIVPVGLIGVRDVLPPGARWPRRRRLTVRFGAPLCAADLAPPEVDRRQRLQCATELIMARIAELSGHEARAAALARMRREQREA
jgi:1-acyl-sn-glycerol-3-phosphate acyltransferase